MNELLNIKYNWFPDVKTTTGKHVGEDVYYCICNLEGELYDWCGLKSEMTFEEAQERAAMAMYYALRKVKNEIKSET